jgi:hypothetical protein
MTLHTRSIEQPETCFQLKIEERTERPAQKIHEQWSENGELVFTRRMMEEEKSMENWCLRKKDKTDLVLTANEYVRVPGKSWNHRNMRPGGGLRLGVQRQMRMKNQRTNTERKNPRCVHGRENQTTVSPSGYAHKRKSASTATTGTRRLKPLQAGNSELRNLGSQLWKWGRRAENGSGGTHRNREQEDQIVAQQTKMRWAGSDLVAHGSTKNKKAFRPATFTATKEKNKNWQHPSSWVKNGDGS